MKVCLFVPSGAVNEPLRAAVREVFSSHVAELAPDSVSAWPEIISAADLALIDVTAANALGCYAVGCADALKKDVILLTPIGEAVPNTFADRRTVIHAWNIEYLTRELNTLTTSAPETTATDNSPPGQFYRQFGDLLKKHGYRHDGPLEFDGSTFTLREQNMELPLVQEIAQRAKARKIRVRLL